MFRFDPLDWAKTDFPGTSIPGGGIVVEIRWGFPVAG